MSFRIRIDPVAQSEIDHFTAYFGAYDEEFAIEQSSVSTAFFT
jgi:hypothetical protein